LLSMTTSVVTIEALGRIRVRSTLPAGPEDQLRNHHVWGTSSDAQAYGNSGQRQARLNAGIPSRMRATDV